LRPQLPVHPWPQRTALVDGALAFGVALVLATGAIWLVREPGSIASIWLANGAVIGIAVSAPAGRRLGLLLLASLDYFIANLLYDRSVMNALAFAPGNFLDLLIGTWWLGQRPTLLRFLGDARVFLRLLVRGALLPPLAGALAGALFLDLVGHSGFSVTWSDWFIESAIGSLVMLPLTLTLRARAVGEGVKWGRVAVALLLVGAASLACFALAPYPFGLVGVILLAVAYSQSRLVTFAAGPLVVVMFGLAVGYGWLVPETDDTPLGHAWMYFTLLLVVAPPQVVSIIVARQRALDEILAVVGHHAHQLAAFVDMRGTLRWANGAREAYWGVSNEHSLGKPWLDHLPDAHYRRAMQGLFEKARAGQVVQQVMQVDFPVCGRRTMAVHLQPAHDEDRQQLGVLYTSTDVTSMESSRLQLEALTASLATSHHDLQQFVRISSHDLREPLNSIVQFTTLMDEQEGERLSAESRDYLRRARAAASRMGRILEDVRLYVQTDELDPASFRTVDLAPLVRDALLGLDERIAALGATVRVEGQGRVRGDAAQLTLAVTNLLGNALTFMPPGRAPSVRVTVRPEGAQLALCVADNGIGIPTEKLALLGQPFKRLHSRSIYPGTGLGLAICQRIAHKHGGRLDMRSTPSQGSCFCLLLPCLPGD